MVNTLQSSLSVTIIITKAEALLKYKQFMNAQCPDRKKMSEEQQEEFYTRVGLGINFIESLFIEPNKKV